MGDLSPYTLDRYIDHQSAVHALDARVKLPLVLTYLVGTTLVPTGAWATLAALALLLWWSVTRARLSLRMVMQRAVVALPFALVAVSMMFTVPGPVLFRLDMAGVSVTATTTGLILFLTILVKSWLSVQAVLLLTATTHALDVIRALHAFRLPVVLITILAVTYRYLFVLMAAAQQLGRARACRSAAVPGRRSGRNVLWHIRVLGHMIGTLFLRSYERSERIYVAMISRGYDGEVVSLSSRPIPLQQRGILTIGLATIAAIIWVSLVFL